LRSGHNPAEAGGKRERERRRGIERIERERDSTSKKADESKMLVLVS
jgi:hypothetical protein